MPRDAFTAAEERQFDELAAEVLGLLRKGLTERPFGRLTVTFNWKAHELSKMDWQEGGERLLALPTRQ